MSEKIYPASAQKRKDAREKGQVAKSNELITLVLLFTSMVYVYIKREAIFSAMNKLLSITTRNILLDNFKVNSFVEYLKIVVVFMVPFWVIVYVAAFLGNYFQVGLKFTLKPIKPEISKINPINGFKRMFSKDALVDLGKALLKVVGVIYITYVGVKDIIGKMNNVFNNSLYSNFSYIFESLFSIVIKILMLLLGLAIVDFMYKKHKFEEDLKMTREEMMEEYKRMEGNPQIKQRQREFGRMLTKRQIQTVKEASFVITNPTHFAVAIKYDAQTHPLPVVIFKGVDEIAQSAKKIAAENNIPMIENVPLARALYAKVKEGNTIPEEFFESIIEVITYVYTLDKKNNKSSSINVG